MPLTTAQLATFKAAINADPALATARANLGHGEIANYYNAPGTGSIWRPSIQAHELNSAIVWTEFAVLSLQIQGTYMAMLAGGTIDATDVDMRNGFGTVFGAPTASRANLLALAARMPTRFEALFTVANVCAVFGQQATVDDVVRAMES